jgi:hypothetical protein
MGRFPAFLLGVVTGAAMLHVAMSFHVVRSRDGIELVGKQPARLSEAYVDIRSFGVGDWAGHPQLAASLVRANKQHLLGDSASQAIQESVQQLVPNWSNQ